MCRRQGQYRFGRDLLGGKRLAGFFGTTEEGGTANPRLIPGDRMHLIRLSILPLQ